MYMAIANHVLNMIRDAHTPYGYPNSPSNRSSSWILSVLFVAPLLFTTLEQTPEGCTRCTLINPSLGTMWMFQWTVQVYVAILPLVAICFYQGKYAEHPDYEALHKAGNTTWQRSFHLNSLVQNHLNQVNKICPGGFFCRLVNLRYLDELCHQHCLEPVIYITIASIWRENMRGYLSADVICSE